MAVIFAESFDYYGDSGDGGLDFMKDHVWVSTNQFSALVDDGTARTGNLYFRALPSGNAGVNSNRLVLPSSYTDLGMALGIRFPALPSTSNRNLLTFVDVSNNEVVSLVIQPDGTIQAYAGDTTTGTLLSSSSKRLRSSSWEHLEVHIIVSSSVGEIEIRLNEVTVLHVTGLDLGTSEITGFSVPPIGSGTGEMHFDDMVFWDATGTTGNDFLGRVRVSTVFPDADGSTFDWSSTEANGYEAVGEVPPDEDTTYISASTVNDVAELEVPTLPTDIDTIEGVYVPVLARQETAGSTNMQISIISGGIEDTGDEQPIGDTYGYYGQVFPSDPNTSGAKWTKTTLEAAKVKIERTL